MDQGFWKGKKVFITGHTGFKGSWLSLFLCSLGARITGYALHPPTKPSMFELCKIDATVHSIIADIREVKELTAEMLKAEPQIVFHLAAQPLVVNSYRDPLQTYSTNVMGTANLFEAVRQCKSVKAVINVTTDKCYQNHEWVWGYRENDMLGGYDPYSSSKACSELVTSAYRSSYFNSCNYYDHGVSIATVRAGNVIGGGDWTERRLVPDCLKAFCNGNTIHIRNPYSIRPWQHVLEPLSGYLLLAQKLVEYGTDYGEAWNFGPEDADAKSVEWVVRKLCEKWGVETNFLLESDKHFHEANYLKLDCSKAKARLEWYPRWSLEQALDKTIAWTHAYVEKRDLREISIKQIEEYLR